MRLLAFGGLALAMIVLLFAAAPSVGSRPDPFYRGERERLALEYDRLGLEEARWSSQARQMAWAQQLTQPSVVYVEPQATPAAPIWPVLLLIPAFGGMIALGVALWLVFWHKPSKLSPVPVFCVGCNTWQQPGRYCVDCGATLSGNGETVPLRERVR
jgi:hypothetical protein